MAATTEPRRIGRYELCSKFASGGMASVYFGRIVGSEGFSRVVAIKRMHPHLAQVAEFRAMFIDEARLAARISHPNVAHIIDLVAESDELLLVMSYIHGASLSGLLSSDRALLGTAIAVRIAIDALYGLHAAHTAKDASGAALGIVHRDVSPQNILVTVEGATVLVDFGVAKAAARLQTSREGQLKGKLRYMPPEQVRQDAVSAGTDVYAVAVVLWEMLTGEKLFTGTNDAVVLAQVLDGAVVSPRTLVPELSEVLEAIVMRGLERDASKRYPTALSMAEALEGLDVAASQREVATVVATRARAILEARNAAMRSIDERSSAPALIEGVGDGTLTASPQVDAKPEVEGTVDPIMLEPRGPSRTVIVGAVVGLVTCGLTALAFLGRGAVSPVPTPPVAAESSAPSAPSAMPLAPPVMPVPSAAAAPDASPMRTDTNAPRPSPAHTVPRHAPDCTNPKVLGPDGVYHVRRECLGR